MLGSRSVQNSHKCRNRTTFSKFSQKQNRGKDVIVALLFINLLCLSSQVLQRTCHLKFNFREKDFSQFDATLTYKIADVAHKNRKLLIRPLASRFYAFSEQILICFKDFKNKTEFKFSKSRGANHNQQTQHIL